ncbi:hypothetical protein C8J56DRAFT_1040575 [Mycena floridula]|nr:hypothetical protein C8J56DRAFT_1040575 [Mycena floridula]
MSSCRWTEAQAVPEYRGDNQSDDTAPLASTKSDPTCACGIRISVGKSSCGALRFRLSLTLWCAPYSTKFPIFVVQRALPLADTKKQQKQLKILSQDRAFETAKRTRNIRLDTLGPRSARRDSENDELGAKMKLDAYGRGDEEAIGVIQ